MAKKPATKKAPALRPLVLHQWTVTREGHPEVTIEAHDCDAYGGALTFTNREYGPKKDSSYMLVRAFARGAWLDVQLVGTVEG